jgi:hypothetical protein
MFHRVTEESRAPRTVRPVCISAVRISVTQGEKLPSTYAATVLPLSQCKLSMPSKLDGQPAVSGPEPFELFPLSSRQDMHCRCIGALHVSPLMALTAYDPHRLIAVSTQMRSS